MDASGLEVGITILQEKQERQGVNLAVLCMGNRYAGDSPYKKGRVRLADSPLKTKEQVRFSSPLRDPTWGPTCCALPNQVRCHDILRIAKRNKIGYLGPIDS